MQNADILIVDDAPANLTVLSNILRGEGYRVRVAPNGERALVAAAKEVPDLILLDINMPDLNGYDVCRSIKSQAGLRDVPIIFISAMDEVDDKIEAFEAGGADYITKPFQIREVLARVDNQLTLRHQQQQIARLVPELSDALNHLVSHIGQPDAVTDTANIMREMLDELQSLVE